MGKKKAKPNAFSVFMFEFIEKERQAGRRHQKAQWADVAKPHFDRLTPEQKERYKQKAKNQPTKTYSVAPKYTSQGVPLELIEREQQEADQKARYMERKVKNLVENGFLDNGMRKKSITFIMANYFYKTHDGLYSPAEIAVAKFTFEDAIYKVYHSFINPGTPQLGYAYAAKERSEKYHRLPPPPNAKGEKCYEKLYADILDIVGARHGDIFDKDDEHRPCLFIRKDDIEMIESILDQLSDKQWIQIFDIFELELLFNKLKNKVEELHGGEELRITVTTSFIEQDQYDATPNISCDFHENEDVTRHCALSYVRRWFFLFADHICEKIGVPLVAGKHLPSNAALVPPTPFDDDDIKDRNKFKFDPNDAHTSDMSRTYTGYQKLETDSDCISSDSDSDY